MITEYLNKTLLNLWIYKLRNLLKFLEIILTAFFQSNWVVLYNHSALFTVTVKHIQNGFQDHGQEQNPKSQKTPGTRARSRQEHYHRSQQCHYSQQEWTKQIHHKVCVSVESLNNFFAVNVNSPVAVSMALSMAHELCSPWQSCLKTAVCSGKRSP